MRPVAALYVDTRFGVYPRIEGVKCYGVNKDARLYAGPDPIVAHPSCAYYGKFAWNASPEFADCAPIAVEQVRKWKGVLEHPAYSTLWATCSLPFPGNGPDAFGGYSIEVAQCDWGHQAEKLTWLYIVGCQLSNLPEFPPTRVPSHKIGDTKSTSPEISKRDRHLTTMEFAKWLVEVARRTSVDQG